MKDGFGRDIDYMRVSVTDRCNLRCIYCMPEDGVPSLSHSQVLSYEEILRIISSAAELGIKRIRLTGGEPLVRRGIENLISEIKHIEGIEQVAITTNGILIPEKFEELKSAGLDGVNISLDTLTEERFNQITRREGLSKVLTAIDLCEAAGINTKVNCVAMKGVNDDEFTALAELTRDKNICVRFIEYMPVGKHDFEKTADSAEIKAEIIKSLGKLTPDEHRHGRGPAEYFKIDGFRGSVGFISAMSNCFCSQCNRIRLTAEGFLKLCLQYDTGVSLRELLRRGCSDEELKTAIETAVKNKPRQHTFNDYKEADDIEENGMSRIGG